MRDGVTIYRVAAGLPKRAVRTDDAPQKSNMTSVTNVDRIPAPKLPC